MLFQVVNDFLRELGGCRSCFVAILQLADVTEGDGIELRKVGPAWKELGGRILALTRGGRPQRTRESEAFWIADLPRGEFQQAEDFLGKRKRRFGQTGICLRKNGPGKNSYRRDSRLKFRDSVVALVHPAAQVKLVADAVGKASVVAKILLSKRRTDQHLQFSGSRIGTPMEGDLVQDERAFRSVAWKIKRCKACLLRDTKVDTKVESRRRWGENRKLRKTRRAVELGEKVFACITGDETKVSGTRTDSLALKESVVGGNSE